MERFRLNLVISPKADPSLHHALSSLPQDIRSARLKELALAGLMGSAYLPQRGDAATAPAPAPAPAAPAKPSAPAQPAAANTTRPALDIEGQLNGVDDLGLTL